MKARKLFLVGFCILVACCTNKRKNIETFGNEVYAMLDEKPEFLGGMPGLMEFMRRNIQYPQAARQSKLEGWVIMQVVIDKDGSVTQPRIFRSINPVSDVDAVFCEEALRIVSIMPKWKPGSQHGMNMKARFTFPIKFESPTD